MFDPLELIFKYNEFLNQYEKANYYNNPEFYKYSSNEGEWKGITRLEELKLNSIIPSAKLEVFEMLLGKEKDLSSYFSKVFYIKVLSFTYGDYEDNSIEEFLIKAEEFGFPEIELEIYDCQSLKYLAKYISHYRGYLHIYSQKSNIKYELVRALSIGNGTKHFPKKERTEIINLFEILLSRTTKYDLDNKYKHDFILGKDLLSEFFADEYREVVPSLVYLSKRVIEKELQSRDEEYLALVNKKIPPGILNAKILRIPLGVNDGIIYKFLEETLSDDFSRIELEIKNLEALKCLAEFILFYQGYKGYLHIYSDDWKFEQQLRDIIQDENHTYASKEDRANIINLFKTLLSRATKSNLGKYPNKSILNEYLLSKFLEEKYDEVAPLHDSTQLFIEEKRYSVKKTSYAERFNEKSKIKKLLLGIGLRGLDKFEIGSLVGSCYQVR